VYAEDPAAIRFRNNEADAASVFGNPRITKSGEKMSPPPRPTMVSNHEIKNMATTRSKEKFITKTIRHSEVFSGSS